MAELVHPTQVKVVGTHRIWLRFDDGVEGEVDLSDDDWVGVFEPLEDPEYFAKVELSPHGDTIVWPNGADIAPETLHAWVTGALPMGKTD